MKIDVIDLVNKEKKSIEVSKDIFGLSERKDILHRVVCWQLNKRRSGTHKTKGISEISGTTKKPWRQKGTGRARAGSLRAPQMRKGATIFGPVVRDHGHQLPKKIRKLGLKTALSSKLKSGDLMVLDALIMNGEKTKDAQKLLQDLNLKSALFIDIEINDNPFSRAIANIPGVDVLDEAGINVYDILRHDKIILTKHVIEKVEKRLK